MDKQHSLLIVEDEPICCTLLKALLENSGLSLTPPKIAVTLSEAIEALQQFDIDAVLLDLNLPDSRGENTLSQITRQFPEKAIIVITGQDDTKMGLTAIAHGAQDYLIKGKYTVEHLTKSIRYSISRKEAQEAAKRSERIFETLINHLPQGILLKDLSLQYLFCNQNYADSLHLPVHDVLGKTDFDFYPENIARRNAAFDLQVIRIADTLEDTQRYEYNGREQIVRVSKTAVKNDTGGVEGVLCVFEDFTRRAKYEEAIKQANEELQKTNQQLIEMQSQLVQSEKLVSIGQLAAGVAHEINNPLGFVSSNFSTLEKYLTVLSSILSGHETVARKVRRNEMDTLQEEIEKIEEEKEKEHLDFILEDIPGLFCDSREGIRRIIQIVKSLRDFSRIDQMEDCSEFNINEGIKATLVVAKNELKYAVDIQTELDTIPDVFCNSGQLNQVFLNLLVNAAHAIAGQKRKERGTVRIRTYYDDTYVSCEISDDGPGIPQENLSKIFDPFFTTKPVGEGTGLGLNVSYDIVVNKHKGLLLVDSRIGRGTTFTIRIPRDLDVKMLIEDGKERNHGNKNSLVC